MNLIFFIIIGLFVIGYSCIALEHPLKVNKVATALLLGVLLWVVFIMGGEEVLVNANELRNFSLLNEGSGFHDCLVLAKLIALLGDISQILFFLIGAMAMYDFSTNHYFWEFLAYCTGIGGSILIIGSAAGIAVIGLEKNDFICPFKKITWIVLIGYFVGYGVFIAEKIIHKKLAMSLQPKRLIF